jgi:hypothetical protein
LNWENLLEAKRVQVDCWLAQVLHHNTVLDWTLSMNQTQTNRKQVLNISKKNKKWFIYFEVETRNYLNRTDDKAREKEYQVEEKYESDHQHWLHWVWKVQSEDNLNKVLNYYNDVSECEVQFQMLYLRIDVSVTKIKYWVHNRECVHRPEMWTIGSDLDKWTFLTWYRTLQWRECVNFEWLWQGTYLHETDSLQCS